MYPIHRYMYPQPCLLATDKSSTGNCTLSIKYWPYPRLVQCFTVSGIWVRKKTNSWNSDHLSQTLLNLYVIEYNYLINIAYNYLINIAYNYLINIAEVRCPKNRNQVFLIKLEISHACIWFIQTQGKYFFLLQLL